jgi:hypothetical protein
MRALSLLAPLCPLVLAACPSGSIIGEPCTDGGEEVCEGDVLIRCDGQVYVQLAPCANKCIEEKAAVSHDNADVSANETWTCAEGPHVVETTMTVQSGATLTIEAGAIVRIKGGARINTVIDGRIEAKGTSAATILVTSESGEAAGFGGLAEGGLNVFAVADGEPSSIEHTIVERGLHGIGIFGLSSDRTPPVIENNTLRDNTNYGIVIDPCGEADPPMPDWAADGNQFFRNGDGDVSPCTLP